ncbi:SDR family NAD(P)-dependent oxidoreductase [Luteimonas sp. BDR2-5]|uniref:SDR family NAD(P)-dependent oxidoreductase n=1 Tax=Proluteimonas luteida TaxID=2878685 RepID=UPI001E4A3CD1|nr:SDR family NAD(P)-dependent oxidoreductase [Luteimonas sp. BDR2-5]MCD9028363.1 SDR family NAD(P)-dependent oxidoreductase [Luteimonas sp. BDR2-5]
MHIPRIVPSLLRHAAFALLLLAFALPASATPANTDATPAGQRTVLITGASSGIGAAAAQRFAEDGWKVVATGRRAERLQPLVDAFGPERVHAAVFDLRDAQALDAALAALPEGFRDIDLLINNAGLALGTESAQDASLDDWRTMIDTNVTALVTLTHKLLPGLIARRGQIINIGSVAGLYPYPGSNVYGASKAFVEQFSMGLRSDLRGTGVRVTVVQPGLVETEFTLVRTGGDRSAHDAAYSDERQPMEAADIGEALAWLASLPPRVNVNRLEVVATTQSFARLEITPLESP